MRKFKQIIAVIMMAVCLFAFAGCKTNEPPEAPAQKHAVGVVVYNGTPLNETYAKIKETPSKISELVCVSNGEILTTDSFLFYYYSPSMTLENTESIKTNTTTKNAIISNTEHLVDFEVVFEATEVLIFVVYRDDNGNYSFEFEKEITSLDEITPTLVSININNNSDITKLNLKLAKDILIEEEYQRD